MKNVYRMGFILGSFGILMTALVSVMSRMPGLSEVEKSDLFGQLPTGMMLTCAGVIIWTIAKAAEHVKK
jgi:hypothetical protein